MSARRSRAGPAAPERRRPSRRQRLSSCARSLEPLPGDPVGSAVREEMKPRRRSRRKSSSVQSVSAQPSRLKQSAAMMHAVRLMPMADMAALRERVQRAALVGDVRRVRLSSGDRSRVQRAASNGSRASSLPHGQGITGTATNVTSKLLSGRKRLAEPKSARKGIDRRLGRTLAVAASQRRRRA